MNPDDLSVEIVKVIKEKKISPKPRWEFSLKNGLWLATAVFLALFGAIAVAVSVFMFNDHDHDELILALVPSLWLILLLLVSLFGAMNLRQMKNAYRHCYWQTAIMCVLFSVVLGLVLVYFNFGSVIHRWLWSDVPAYQELIKDFDHPTNF